MSESRQIYRVSANSPVEINRILGLLADRLDQLEGFRGQADFLRVPTSREAAAAGNELVLKSQIGTIEALTLLNTSSLTALAASVAAQLALRRLYESGEMFINTNQTVALTNQDEWYQITGYTTGHTHNITGGTDSLLPTTPGHWRLSGYVSGITTAAGQVIQFGFAVNGAVDTDHLARCSFGTTDPEELSFGGIIEVPEGGALTMWARNLSSSGKTLTVYCSALIAEIIHPEDV